MSDLYPEDKLRRLLRRSSPPTGRESQVAAAVRARLAEASRHRRRIMLSLTLSAIAFIAVIALWAGLWIPILGGLAPALRAWSAGLIPLFETLPLWAGPAFEALLHQWAALVWLAFPSFVFLLAALALAEAGGCLLLRRSFPRP